MLVRYRRCSLIKEISCKDLGDSPYFIVWQMCPYQSLACHFMNTFCDYLVIREITHKIEFRIVLGVVRIAQTQTEIIVCIVIIQTRSA